MFPTWADPQGRRRVLKNLSSFVLTRFFRQRSYPKNGHTFPLNIIRSHASKSCGSLTPLRYDKTQNKKIFPSNSCFAKCLIASWILLESVLLYGKLSNFWALNIVFYPQFVCGLFGSPILLNWDLEHYLDNFMVLLPSVKATPNRIQIQNDNYIHFTDILAIPLYGTKDLERTLIPVFDIKVDTNFFTVCLQCNKPHKAFELFDADLNKQSMTLLKV